MLPKNQWCECDVYNMRMKYRLLTLTVIVFSAISVTAQKWVLRFDGIGPVKIGMTLSDLKHALREDPAESDYLGSCYVHSKRHPHVQFMMEDGVVTRIDVNDKTIPSIQGFRIGDLEARLRKSAGSRAEVERHHYFERGHYVTINSSEGRFAMRFETSCDEKSTDPGSSDEKFVCTKPHYVTSFYAGRPESVQYIEGCL